MTTFKYIAPKGFLLNDNDTGVDHLGQGTFADAIAESLHHVETPITVGLYAKWGSGKSFLIRHVENKLKRFQAQHEMKDASNRGPSDHNLKANHFCRAALWILLILFTFGIILVTLLLEFKPSFVIKIFGKELDALEPEVTPNSTTVATNESSKAGSTKLLQTTRIIAFVLLPFQVMAIFLMACFGNSWLSSSYYGSCRLLTYGAFTKLPFKNQRNNIVEDPGEEPAKVLKHIKRGDERVAMAACEAPVFPRRYIFVDFKAWEYAGSDTLWAAIVTKITDAIEEEFGMITARMFRMLKIEEIEDDICNDSAKTLCIDLERQAKESDIRDMMEQYGVVESCKKLEKPNRHDHQIWKVKFATDGECRSARECLEIEGLRFYDSNDNTAANTETSRFHRNQPVRESQRHLIEQVDGNAGQEYKRLDDLSSPPKTFGCNRFCSHFLKHPTKILCLPRLVWWILIMICAIFIPVSVYVIADHFHLDVYRTYRTVPIYGQVLLWLPASAAVTMFMMKFVWAMCHSQRKRIYAALDGTKNKMAEELGFMSKVKNEIAVVTKLIQCARFTHQKEYKIVIAVDDLDRIPLEKVQSVLEAVNILLSDKSSPFMCLIAVDSRVVVKCIEANMGDALKESKITGHEYLKKIINLPICLPQIHDGNKKRFIAGLIDQADHTITYRQIEERQKFRHIPRVVSESFSSVPSPSYANGREEVDAATATRIASADIHNPSNSDDDSDNPTTSSRNVVHFDSFSHANGEAIELTELTDKSKSQNLNGGGPGIKVTEVSNPIRTFMWRRKESTITSDKKIELKEKEFLFHCRRYIYENEQLHRHIHGNPRNIKRIFNVISLTASIINSFLKKQKRREFFRSRCDGGSMGFTNKWKIERTKEVAEDIVKWIILTDQWPYRTSYIVQVIEDADQRVNAGLTREKLDEDWTIYEIYQNKVKEELEAAEKKYDKSEEWLLSLDGDPDLFYSYIIFLKQGNFTADKIMKIMNYTVSLDYSIRHAIAFRRDLSCLTPLTEPKDIDTPSSSDSGNPETPSEANSPKRKIQENKLLIDIRSPARPYSWHNLEEV